jgi:hypothetical protein
MSWERSVSWIRFFWRISRSWRDRSWSISGDMSWDRAIRRKRRFWRLGGNRGVGGSNVSTIIVIAAFIETMMTLRR